MATAVSKSLNASLLPHQSEGVDWCLSQESKCCILAYDMGLGKTIIGCALIVAKPVQTLIMVPTSLILQWKAELEQHTSGLNVAIYHGANRKYKSVIDAARNADVILTTASVVANDIKNNVYAFKNVKRWIIDEAHKLRNSRSKTYKYLHLYAPLVANKVFLTGTPICNSLDDLISLVCLSNKQHYNELEVWKGITTSAKYKMLEEISDDIILRKTKSDTIAHILPAMTFNTIELGIESDQQKDTYNHFLGEQMVLKKILRMRQSINNHIQLIEELVELSDLAEEPESEDCTVSTSIKLQKIVEILQNVPKDDKVIIVSYFTKLLQEIHKILPVDKQSMALYHGGLNVAERNEVVSEFKYNPSVRILLMNLRAGGCGLNLVEANHIILMEPYWNDAEEQQAINRVYRIGQKKPVTVYKLVVNNSIESWLLKLQKYKEKLSTYLLEDTEVETDVTIEKEKLKGFFRFVKDMKIDDDSEQNLQEFIETNDIPE